MKENKMQIFLIVFAAITRLVPHAWNFTAVGSVGLFAGANLPLRKALVIPLVPLLISDFIMGGMYEWQSMLTVYCAFLLSPVIGRYMIAGREKLITITAGVALNAIAFFVITNLGVFATGYYGFTVEGLTACFIAAIPFLSAAVMGDAVFATALFGGKALFIHMKEKSEADAQTA